MPGTDVSSPFVMMNRNKRGVALNLREEAGRQALGNLIVRAAQTPNCLLLRPELDLCCAAVAGPAAVLLARQNTPLLLLCFCS